MPVFIFINGSDSYGWNTSSYTDTISVNPNGNKKIIYTGQSAGKKDHELIKGIQDNDEFFVFSRPKSDMLFTFRGSTRRSKVVRARTAPIGRIPGSRKFHAASPSTILIVEFDIPPCPDTIVPVVSSCTSYTKFKSSALLHTGMFTAHNVPNRAQDGFYTRVYMPSSPLVEARLVVIPTAIIIFIMMKWMTSN